MMLLLGLYYRLTSSACLQISGVLHRDANNHVRFYPVDPKKHVIFPEKNLNEWSIVVDVPEPGFSYLYTWDKGKIPQLPVYTPVANGEREIFSFQNYLDVRKTMNCNHIIRFWFRHLVHQCGNILLEFSIGSKDDLKITIHEERVNGERVNAERVNGERVNCERVNGERLNDERVKAERVNAERVNDERVNAERVNGKRLNE
jgi:hypothetical protein